MYNNSLKTDLQVLAEAQTMFELNGWNNKGSFQKVPASNSAAWGTLFEKNDKIFYLNIISAPKAIQMLRNTF